jgi:hypothetical protein
MDRLKSIVKESQHTVTIHAVECNKTRTGKTIYWRFFVVHAFNKTEDVTGCVALAMHMLVTPDKQLQLPSTTSMYQLSKVLSVKLDDRINVYTLVKQ